MSRESQPKCLRSNQPNIKVGRNTGQAIWTSHILLDTFNSYNVTSNRGVYEQRKTLYPRV